MDVTTKALQGARPAFSCHPVFAKKPFCVFTSICPQNEERMRKNRF